MFREKQLLVDKLNIYLRSKIRVPFMSLQLEWKLFKNKPRRTMETCGQVDKAGFSGDDSWRAGRTVIKNLLP